MTFKCPKCGKAYKTQGAYYKKHIESCTGKIQPSKPKKKISSKIKAQTSSSIIKRLEKIENRLYMLEQDFKGIRTSRNNKFKIENEKTLFDIIYQKIQELSKKMLGIQKVLLRDLYNEINKEYYISIENFSKFLMKLNNANKIQLESGTSEEDFSIRDNYGNVFKLIRVLD